MKKLNKKGFTIVELVIVIAVIAILAGVLIPTFATVVNRANESAAMQQAKNAYEDYLAGYADSKDLKTNFYIQVNTGKTPYYFEVKDSQFNSKAITNKPASGSYVILEKSNTTFPTTTDESSKVIVNFQTFSDNQTSAPTP